MLFPTASDRSSHFPPTDSVSRVNFIVTIRRINLAIFIVALALFAAGCRKEDDIERYTVEKPHIVFAENHADSPVPKADRKTERTSGRIIGAIVSQGKQTWFFKAMGPDAAVAEQMEEFLAFIKSVRFSDAKPSWTLPKGWREAADSAARPMSMRFATIKIGSEPDPLELSVIPLPTLGEDYDKYLLANINRWRGQLGLPPTTRETLFNNEDRSEETRQIEVDGTTVTLVNLVGTIESGGPQRPPFAPFASGRGAGPSAPPQQPGAAGAPRVPRSSTPTASSSLGYETPKGWKPGRLTSGGSMAIPRAAAFEVSDGSRKVEITVIALPPSGLLANINRWRGQVGLGPTTQTELNQDLRELQVDGNTGRYVELAGPRQTILGVIVNRSGRAWFFKLTGDSQLAKREQKRFEAFVQSVKFNSR